MGAVALAAAPLTRTYVSGDVVTKVAVDAAWTAQHQFGGALLGEHLGQLLVTIRPVAGSRQARPPLQATP